MAQDLPPRLRSLMLVGCGAMGSALLRGWLLGPKRPLFSSMTVITPRQESVAPFVSLSSHPLQWAAHPSAVDITPDLVFFAVKPQILPSIVQDYTKVTAHASLIMTSAAGLSLAFYDEAFPTTPIVRTMPNMPAAVGAGITGLYASPSVSAPLKKVAEQLLQAVGKTVWLHSDEEMDKITALSGCGPAYLFSLVEALEKAGTLLGFDAETASLLARQTIIGSAASLAQSSKTAAELRHQVTSPGGMTEAGLAVLQENHQFESFFEKAIQASLNRATSLKKLSQGKKL